MEGNEIKLNEMLSGKNVNFLVGSGASAPAYKTLSLGDDKPSLEDLLSSNDIDDNSKKVLYYFYFRDWILPMTNIIKSITDDEKKVIENYNCFLRKLIYFLQNESNEKPKRINIFTTNYDLMFEKTFQNLLNEKVNCYFNDDSVGFISKTLNAQNFNLSISRTGYLDSYKNEVPTINLIKIHGSISWEKRSNDIIGVNYDCDLATLLISNLDGVNFIDTIVSSIENNDYTQFNKNLLDLYQLNKEDLNSFYIEYQKLSIINPNKWKFHETVFEQHYYQQLRNFSYEMEKENTILIVFGFSFADEHVKEVFERALVNPTLKVYVICHKEEVRETLKTKFKNNKNIEYLPDFKDNKNILGDFSFLNGLLGDPNE